MRPVQVLTLVLAAALAGCSDAPLAPQRAPAAIALTAAVQPAAVNVPGSTHRRLIVDGQQREYWVHVGSTAQPNAPLPVVVFLHGTSGNGLQYLNISRWREKADTAGFIAVFPSALAYCFRADENNDGDMDDPRELHATTKWTQGSLGDTLQPLCRPRDYLKLSPHQRQLTMHRFQDDTLFLDAMVADLKANFIVDTKRMYIAGFSNGGEMVSRLLVVRSHLFAAMASHAGHMHIPPAPIGARRVPFLRSVGSLDDHYFAQMPGGAMPVAPGAINFPFIQRTSVVPYLQQGLLANAPVWAPVTWNGRRIGLWNYPTGLVGNTNPFAFLLIEGNTHAYPNGKLHEVTMADRTWPFFAAHQLP